MKAKSILAALLLMVAGIQTVLGQATMTVNMKDGTKHVFGVQEVGDVTFSEDDANNEHEWVDLGLPSGTKWATMNVGASRPEDYGSYFAWGETQPKNEYNCGTYKWCKGSDDTMTRYCIQSSYGYNGFTDNLTELLPEDDAATVNWGGSWCMPTFTQIEELLDNCSCYWTTLNGVKGTLVTGPNSNTIFLPAAGYRDGTTIRSTGSDCEYWSSSNDPEEDESGAYGISVDAYMCDWLYFFSREFGRSVRPVYKKNSATKPVTGITLSSSSLSLEVGKTQTLTATIQPADATDKSVTWTSSNTSVATVSTSGKVTAKAVGTCTVTCAAQDGSGIKAECKVTVKQTGINGHAFVEIGGLKWATMNVGATTVAGSYATCYGDYYAWGETQPRYASITRSAAGSASFTWKNGYSSGYSYNNWPTYTGTTLDASHDAARANWGGTWRTPTKAEYEALAAACSGRSANGQTPVTLINTITEGGIYWLSDTQTIESAYTGVAGLLFVSASDISKRVFFPASGYVYDTSLYGGGTGGYYWSSSLYTSLTYYAYRLYFYSSDVHPSNSDHRCRGFAVRPVSD